MTGFISWALALLIVMEVIRTYLVISRQVPANGFTPDNATLSPFMQRFARAHANCIEGLPIFGGLIGVSIMISKTEVTDPLAYTLLGARIVQSMIHLVSTNRLGVSLRFSAFAVQMAIGAYWSRMLLT
ncbi:MAPEG family protein [Mesorhizobium sp. B2-8-5]|uniref:MAPEG family protein n=1 Tax=Mesorhizobium sp. B2-8-5 TaxID=2589903 RepID=UPI001AED7E81|nr:MAPEG family protein [Mesorhizobium sp. B2-8-5]UCI28053.1 MAPEG family protein [Mesorhizobium sp. B2-8-5]